MEDRLNFDSNSDKNGGSSGEAVHFQGQEHKSENGGGHKHKNDHQSGNHHEHEKAAQKIGLVKLAICIVSDSRTIDTDETGKWLKENIKSADGIEEAGYNLIKNDAEAIKKIVGDFINSGSHAIIISGGTGLSSKDITIETITPLFRKTLNGFGEIFRLLSYEEIGVRAIMSRSVCGTAGNKIIISLPGSKNAVKLAYEKIIKPQLHHLIYEATR